MLTNRENPSISSDLDIVVVLGGGLTYSSSNTVVDTSRLREGIKIAEAISRLRHPKFVIPIFYAGALSREQLPTELPSSVDLLHFENNHDSNLQTQIMSLMNYLKNQTNPIKNIVIVSHAYQLERISRVISCNAQLSNRWREFKNVNFFLYGVDRKLLRNPAYQKELIQENNLLKILKRNIKHPFGISKYVSNNIFSDDNKILLTQSFNLHAHPFNDIIFFNSTLKTNITRIRELSEALSFNRYTVSQVSHNQNFMKDIEELKTLSSAIITEPHLRLKDLELLAIVYYRLGIFTLFVLNKRETRRFILQTFYLLRAAKRDHLKNPQFLIVRYLDFYAEIKAFKENGEYYLLDKHITILEAKLTKKNPSQDMRYFTLNLAFLLRCKAKIINFKNKNKDKNKNKEKAKLIYQKAIEYLNKLDVKDFEVQSELALHHLGLCHLENSSSQKQSLLATAATFMDFNVQTLIQVHWYLVRAKLARDERVDPMSYLDKANEIIKNYFKNDENHLSLEYMIVLGKVLIDQGNYDYAKEIYLRISQVIDILGFSNKPFILHINSFIEDKLDEYSKYSEFNETNSRRYKKNKDKVVSIIKIKELFDPYLDDSMKIKFSPFIDNYNRYQESLKSVDTQPEIARSVGRGHLFHQPVRDGSAEFKSDQVAIAPPARQATPFCCNIM